VAVAALAILGGVFDPPHVGHVALARAAIEQLGLESLLVLVIADPGHKPAAVPAETRLALTRMAFEDAPGAEVELDQHARTVDSLEARRPTDAIFLIGADELADFPQWKDPARVLELVRLGVAMRPGVPDERLREARDRLPAPDRVLYFEMEPMSVSSSEIRDRVARGEPIDGLVPPAVADAISRLGLYTNAE
jgi:nicotinate-nucleotide adenylyltransferase